VTCFRGMVEIMQWRYCTRKVWRCALQYGIWTNV